jgi:hypothetical protein
MIRPIFRKDWTLLWPLAVLVTIIQIAFEWAFYTYGFFGANPLANELLRLLTPAWYVGVIALVVAVVHEDTLPGVDQDWLIRPLQRTDLLLAKLLFVLATVCLPMGVLNLIDELAMGFPVVPSLGDALYKEAYLFVTLLIPAMAVASATRNMIDLVVLVASLVVLYAASLWLSATSLGIDRCPTCDTSISWIQHLIQHVGLLVGSGLVLALQYYRRATRVSRLLLAIGVVLLVVVQLPWSVAFAIQTWLGAPIGSSPAAVQIAAGETDITDGTAQGRGRQEGARRATQALLQGDVDAAVLNLRTFRRPHDPPVILNVPLRISGTTQDEFLVVDRAEFSLIDARGAVLYRGTGSERKSVPLISDSDAAAGVLRQQLEVPGAIFRRIGSQASSVVIDYSLTVRAVVAEHRIRAVDGEVSSPEIGICRSGADPSASSIRCKQIGRAPNCYAATLYGPDGRHNPQVHSCGSDYRPFIPSPMNIIGFSGIDLPIRDAYGVAHYEVDGSDLQHSYIILKVYETGEHFRRKVVSRITRSTASQARDAPSSPPM